MIRTIDASGKTIGRLSTSIAHILRGKDKVDFVPYMISGDKVEVINLDKVIFTGKKFKQKKYYHFSGYPGGLKTKKLSEVWPKDPKFVLKNAVLHMLPKNKLRSKIIKNLIIK